MISSSPQTGKVRDYLAWYKILMKFREETFEVTWIRNVAWVQTQLALHSNCYTTEIYQNAVEFIKGQFQFVQISKVLLFWIKEKPINILDC